MFIPLGIVTEWRRRPWANVALMAACVGAFLAGSPRESLALWSRDAVPHAFLTHIFLHGGLEHLIGNMLFLWCFGNAAAGRLHPALYAGFFLFAGLLSGVAELYLSGLDAHISRIESVHGVTLERGICLLGASGAIMGVAGLCLVLYPQHRVRGVFFFSWFFRTLEIRTLLLVLAYAAFDLLYLSWRGHNAGVAYMAHLAGFATGVGCGLLFLAAGWVERDPLDLLSCLGRKPSPRLPPRSSRLLHGP